MLNHKSLGNGLAVVTDENGYALLFVERREAQEKVAELLQEGWAVRVGQTPHSGRYTVLIDAFVDGKPLRFKREGK